MKTEPNTAASQMFWQDNRAGYHRLGSPEVLFYLG